MVVEGEKDRGRWWWRGENIGGDSGEGGEKIGGDSGGVGER
jgi:hypothetical protein